MTTVSLSTQPYNLADRATIVGEDESGQYVLRVKDLPDDQRPREKMLSLGARSLTLPELVAVLWGVGTKKEEVLSMSQRLVQEYGEKSLAIETNPQKLAEVLDIPVGKAIQVIAGFELGRRFYANKAGKAVFVRNARQAFQYLRPISHSNKEQLRGLYLNSRYEVIRDEVISIGTLTSNLIHPREVFQPAIQYGAIAVIIAHNHPSGVVAPTPADIEVTRQLIHAGRVLGIDLLDHLVIANNTYASILECINE